MSPYNFDRTYEKWKVLVFRANILIATVSFLTEILGYFVLKSQDLITDSISYYMLRYLILPTAFNYGVVLVGYFIMKRERFAGRRGDYIPLVQLVLICASNSITHHIFPIITGSLCFPIFVSIIFDNAKLTRNVWLSTYPALLAVYLERRYAEVFMGTACEFLEMETFVAVALTLSAYITCKILTRFQTEKKQIMEDMHQYELELQEELNRESKTGLYNSSAFLNKLYRETEKSRFTQWPLMLLLIDIDDFKKVNDTYGRARGDEVLRRMAQVILKYFKEEEFPSRFGGEEFTAIVREGSAEELKKRVETMRRDFSSQIYGFMDDTITISAGIAVWQIGMTDEKLFDCADKALYVAKHQGKNRIVVWNEAYEKFRMDKMVEKDYNNH